METKQAFVENLMKRQSAYKQKSIKKEKELEKQLDLYEFEAKERIKKYYRNRRKPCNS